MSATPPISFYVQIIFHISNLVVFFLVFMFDKYRIREASPGGMGDKNCTFFITEIDFLGYLLKFEQKDFLVIDIK